MNSFSSYLRKFPIGAEILPDSSGVHFRVWAPDHESVELRIFPENALSLQESDFIFSANMEKNNFGYFSGIWPDFSPDVIYGFILSNNPKKKLPDPASRFQPHGPLGLSKIINPLTYRWNDHIWKGIPEDKPIIYEMHVGTFTAEGTWEGAKRELPELADLGITLIELLPVAEFEGKFDWGYNGIFQFAPYHGYGSPDSFRSFVDSAHQCGIGVILDVVYNHLGIGSDIFKEYSPYYFTKKYSNEWGAAINFDGAHSKQVRQYFLTNASYWIDEYHLDGYRFDATQQIFDSSPVNIIPELVKVVRNTAKGKHTFIVAENECQNTELICKYGIDAVWSDDFHRSSMVALTGHREAYYTDYKGTSQEFISAVKYGYLYQGQYYTWQKKERGTPAFNLKPQNFITYLQNHDQIANSLMGLRIHTLSEPALYRALTVLLLLSPQIPLLFQGQEFCSSAPFYFFSDKDEVAATRAVRGRKLFLSQFKSIGEVDGPMVPKPNEPDAFLKCKLDFGERCSHKQFYLLHRDILAIRKKEAIFTDNQRRDIDGSVLNDKAFLIRYFGHDNSHDRLLIVNLGTDISIDPNPEPLTAPPFGFQWKTILESEDPRYGGNSTIPLIMKGIPQIAGHAAFFLGVSKCQ